METRNPIQEFLHAARDLAKSLDRAENRLHDPEAMTAGMRSVVTLLDRDGPRTVPRIAREQRFSRQYVQSIVDRLVSADLVEKRPNPEHRRSSTIRLTSEGQAVARWTERRHRILLSEVEEVLDGFDVPRSLDLLRRLREVLDDQAD